MFVPLKTLGAGLPRRGPPQLRCYTPRKFNSEFSPEKLPKANMKGSSSIPIIFQGRAVKLRGGIRAPLRTWVFFTTCFFRKGTYHLKHPRIVLRNSFHLGVFVDDWGLLQVYEILYSIYIYIIYMLCFFAHTTQAG